MIFDSGLLFALRLMLECLEDVEKIDVDLANGKVIIAYLKAKNINYDEIEKKILSNGQNMSDLQVLEV